MASTITAGDASSGAILSSDTTGALTLVTGASGAKVNAISIAADGTPTFLKVPANASVQSMVVVTGHSGYGSSATKVRRFANVTNGVSGCVIQGSDITVSDSATAGTTFTINTSGVYSMTHLMTFSVAGWGGISINATTTTDINALSVQEIVSATYTVTGDSASVAQNTKYLSAGSVIRAQNTGNTGGANQAMTQFTIVRVA